MWVRAVSVAFPDSIARIIEIAQEMDITDIYMQAEVAGYAYYSSAILPRSQYLAECAPPSYDPLNSLLKAAQQESIRVHAWVNALLVWSLKNPPDSARHLFYTHPDWFINDIMGRSMHEYSYDEWVQAGLEGLYLDPAHPEVQSHLAAICEELVQNYPVAGVHLDFIRYPGTLWGLAPTDTSYIFAGLDGYAVRWLHLLRYPQLPFLQRWLVWHNFKQNLKKSDYINGIVEKCASALQSTPSEHACLLTAAVFANPSLAWYRFAQQWQYWESIDYPVIMSYCEDVPSFAAIVTSLRQIDPRAIYGIGLLWEHIDTIAFIQSGIVEETESAGLCYFDFTTLDTLVDRSVLMGEHMTFHYVPSDSVGPTTLIPAQFHDRPFHAGFAGSHTSVDATDRAFPDFLLFLSYYADQDLQRLRYTREEFREQVLADILAFHTLDSLVFPLSDTLITPPSYTVAYEFYPWNGQDTLVIMSKARQAKVFSCSTTVFPGALDPIARTACTMKKGQKKVFKTRAGVYAIKLTGMIEGGFPIARESVVDTLLPVYASWTIMHRIEQILTQ
jgi:hypothetical protein